MSRIFTVLLVLNSVTLLSQPVVQLNNYFAEVRTGKHPSVPQEVIRPENATTVMNALSVYYRDSLSMVRAKAFAITRTIGTKSKQRAIRQESVQQLTNACRDKDSGNVGSVVSYLTQFRKEDFTPVAKDSLRNLFKSKPPHYHQLIKLIGFLEMNDLQPELHSISRQTNTSKRDRWAAQLALARMGDQVVMQSILDRVKKLPVNDDVVYEIFPDLIYTRRMEAIQLPDPGAFH